MMIYSPFRFFVISGPPGHVSEKGFRWIYCEGKSYVLAEEVHFPASSSKGEVKIRAKFRLFSEKEIR
jgi:hypothetical protein